jgi:hypothetical protein
MTLITKAVMVLLGKGKQRSRIDPLNEPQKQ